MKNGILLLTNSGDGKHTDSVFDSLKEDGCRVYRLNIDQISTGETKVLFRTPGGSSCRVFQTPQGEVSLEEIRSVWFRRPNSFRFPIKDPTQNDAANNELRSFLEGLWYAMPGIYWMSHPHALERARKKIYQLQLAQSIGFRIPPTIVTNDPGEVLTFFKEQEGAIIFKTLHQGYLDYGDKGYNIPTTLIREEHLEKLTLVRTVPCLFQQHVEKLYELRVTIVGKTVFSVRIDSQEIPETVIDWRLPKYIGKLRHTPVQLPEDLEKRCVNLVALLELNFGAIDIIIDRHHQPVFLEINPNGQWFWLEDLTRLPISKAISESLSHQIQTERR